MNSLRKYYIKTLRFFIGTRLRQCMTLIALAAVIGACVFTLHRLVSAQPSDTQLLRELSGVMIVPKDQPEIATVTDAAVLRSQQAFYTNVENGDVLFIFPQTAKAVLFRPSTRQIVNAGPVNTQDNNSQ